MLLPLAPTVLIRMYTKTIFSKYRKYTKGGAQIQNPQIKKLQKCDFSFWNIINSRGE